MTKVIEMDGRRGQMTKRERERFAEYCERYIRTCEKNPKGHEWYFRDKGAYIASVAKELVEATIGGGE